MANVLLWGDTQVGKTTLLACALCHDQDGIPGIDRARSWREIDYMADQYARLVNNMLADQTIQGFVPIALATTGEDLVFTDMKGGQVNTPVNEAVGGQLDSVDAALFVLNWNDSGMQQSLLPVQRALGALQHKSTGLVFTKCETSLAYSDEAWQCAPGWWRRFVVGGTDAWRILERFGEAVWTTSSYGYDDETRLPACILNEFGLALPYRINPRNVTLPFNWVIDRLRESS